MKNLTTFMAGVLFGLSVAIGIMAWLSPSNSLDWLLVISGIAVALLILSLSSDSLA